MSLPSERSVKPISSRDADAEPDARAARAFGVLQRDLELEMSGIDRPWLVTQILCSCLTDFASLPDGETLLWDWTVEERLYGLIAIARATWPDPPMLELRCSASRCKAAMQIEIDLSMFVSPPRRAAILSKMTDGPCIRARLPRGSDLRHWRNNGEDMAWQATRLVERVDGRIPEPGWRLPEAWLGQLAVSLAEHDPLTVLELDSACPDCGYMNRFAFDLEGWLLRLLADEQSRLLDDVHRLASAYHWTEAQICAIPAWRRRTYLARTGSEVLP